MTRTMDDSDMGVGVFLGIVLVGIMVLVLSWTVGLPGDPKCEPDEAWVPVVYGQVTEEQWRSASLDHGDTLRTCVPIDGQGAPETGS